MSSPEPGEIYYADIPENTKSRRVIVVSRSLLNSGDYLTIVPVTSARFAERRSLRSCVPFKRGQFGFSRDCVAQCDQVATVHKSYFVLDEVSLARLDPSTMRQVIRALGYVFEADCEPEPV